MNSKFQTLTSQDSDNKLHFYNKIKQLYNKSQFIKVIGFKWLKVKTLWSLNYVTTK